MEPYYLLEIPAFTFFLSLPSTPVIVREERHSGCTGLILEVLEELLIEDEGHTTDLLYLGLGRGVAVDKVGRDGDGQLPTELLPSETWKGWQA